MLMLMLMLMLTLRSWSRDERLLLSFHPQLPRVCIVIVIIMKIIIIYRVFFSSEGALYVILPYDYPAAQHPLFEHTPVLNNNFEY